MTSPEELIAAAHSTCFSMALSQRADQGRPRRRDVDTQADVTFQPGTGITGIHLTTRAAVPGLSRRGVRRVRRGREDELPGQRRPHRHHDHPGRHPRLARHRGRCPPPARSALITVGSVAARPHRSGAVRGLRSQRAVDGGAADAAAWLRAGRREPGNTGGGTRMLSRSKASLMRSRSSRWTPKCSFGAHLTTTRIVTASPVTDSTPATVGGSMIFSRPAVLLGHRRRRPRR